MGADLGVVTWSQGRGLAGLPFVLAGACADGRTRGLLGPPLVLAAAPPRARLWCLLFWESSEAEASVWDATLVFFILYFISGNVVLVFQN